MNKTRRYHEVDSSQKSETFDEARYYEGDQFELGGVEFGDNEERQSSRPREHGWDRPGRRSSGYGVPSERIERYHPRTDYHGDPNDGSLDIGHYGKGPKGYQRADARIHEEICEILTHDPHIDATELMVEVKEGEVFLTGTVTDRQSKKVAQRRIEEVRGVKDVHNELKLLGNMSGGLSQRGLEESQRFKMA